MGGRSENSSMRSSTDRQNIHAILAQSLRVSTATNDLRPFRLSRNATAEVFSNIHSTDGDKLPHNRFTKMDIPIIHITSEGAIPLLSNLDPFDSITPSSSGGSDTSSFRSSPKRRIFKCHCKETKEKKKHLSVPSMEGTSSNAKLFNDVEKCNLEEEIYIDTETIALDATDVPVQKKTPSIYGKRRRIFSYKRTNLPEDIDCDKPVFRRASLISILHDQRSSVAESQSRSISVSFNPQVKVYVFQSPQEFHAQDGWSNFFA